VSWAWGVDAGEGEVLKEHAEFFSVGLGGGASSFVPQGRDLAPSDLPPPILGTRSAMG
jgi:hypothetical protein